MTDRSALTILPTVDPTPSRRRRWPFIIAGLLVVHTGTMLTFVTIASRDPTFSVDPDYYGKAVRWDQDQARRRASDGLGWRADVRTTGAPQRTPVLTLTDAAGKPIPGLAVTATCFHHAHGRDVRTVTFAADADDATRFVGDVVLPFAGEWQFDVTARTGGSEFVKTFTIDAR